MAGGFGEMSWWPRRRLLLYPVLGAALGSLLAALYGEPSQWVTRSGLLLDIAGLLQLEVSGWLTSSLEVYSADERYPYGPPSSFTRHEGIIDDPDRPIRAWLQMFGDVTTGLYLIVAGCVLQLGATWL